MSQQIVNASGSVVTLFQGGTALYQIPNGFNGALQLSGEYSALTAGTAGYTNTVVTNAYNYSQGLQNLVAGYPNYYEQAMFSGAATGSGHYKVWLHQSGSPGFWWQTPTDDNAGAVQYFLLNNAGYQYLGEHVAGTGNGWQTNQVSVAGTQPTALGTFTATSSLKGVEFTASSLIQTTYAFEVACVTAGLVLAGIGYTYQFIMRMIRAMGHQGGDL